MFFRYEGPLTEGMPRDATPARRIGTGRVQTVANAYLQPGCTPSTATASPITAAMASLDSGVRITAPSKKHPAGREVLYPELQNEGGDRAPADGRFRGGLGRNPTKACNKETLGVDFGSSRFLGGVALKSKSINVMGLSAVPTGEQMTREAMRSRCRAAGRFAYLL